MINKIFFLILFISISINCYSNNNHYYAMCIDHNSQVMDTPSSSGKELFSVEKGDIVKAFTNKSFIIDNNEKWSFIEIFNRTGWIKAKSLKSKIFLDEIIKHNWSGEYLKWGTDDEYFNIFFLFNNTNTVKIIESPKHSSKYEDLIIYEMNYVSFNYDNLIIFSESPMTPLYVLNKNNNKWNISTYSSMSIDNFQKTNKEYHNFKYILTPIVNNLRFRASPDLSGKFIRMLKNGEKLELIEKGKTEKIQGDKGTWVKVITEKKEIGWCFDAYLEEVK